MVCYRVESPRQYWRFVARPSLPLAMVFDAGWAQNGAQSRDGVVTSRQWSWSEIQFVNKPRTKALAGPRSSLSIAWGSFAGNI